jgi:DNA-binding beta-propeller fold protein YncE
MYVTIPPGGDGYPQGGQPGDSVNLVLGSTITEVVVTPSPATVVAGVDLQMAAEARDDLGRTVLVPPSDAFTWDVSEVAIAEVAAECPTASVSTDGLLTGLCVGGARVVATENESGISGERTVEIGPQLYDFTWKYNSQGELGAALAIEIDGTDKIYLYDNVRERMEIVSAAGVGQGAWSTTAALVPTNALMGIGLDPAAGLLLTVTGADFVREVSVAGVETARWGTSGTADGQLSGPSGVAVNSGGSVYVADGGNDRIEVFNGAGIYQSKFGGTGTGDGELSGPGGLAIDSTDNVWVADVNNSRVQKFDASHSCLGWIGADTGGGAGWHVAGSGALPTGGDGLGQFRAPVDVAVDADDNVYVVDKQQDRVQKFAPGGCLLGHFGTHGSADGELDGPTGVALDGVGAAYVADNGNLRVQKFGPRADVSLVIQ